MAFMRAVAALAVVAAGLNLLAPGFVSAAGSIAGLSRGARAASPARGGDEARGATSTGTPLAATAAAASLCCAGVAAGAATRRVGRRQRTQMRADTSGLVPGGPVHAYMQALMDGAQKSGESVVVTKDVMSARRTLASDQAFQEELVLIQNEYDFSPVEKADKMCGLMGNLESTVFPKFVRFLAKKRRMVALSDICDEYMTNLYLDQSIAPVLCTTAEKLTSGQVEEIKSKMRERMGVSDVKLLVEVDKSLIAGFRLAWGFTDPEDPESATQGLDYSLKRILEDKALAQGVITVA